MAKCRSSRSSGKFLAFAIMCFASVWMIVLYLCFTSCALVHVGDTRTLLERAGAVGDPGGGVYPPDLPEGSVGKRLLQESPSWQYTYDDDDDNMPAVVNANNANDIPKDVSIRFVPENQLNEPTSEDPSNGRTFESSVPRTLLVEGTKKLPQAIIIGVKKGGTRALLEFLRIHPDVRAPGPETHFFDRYYHKGLEWYREQMPPTTDGQMTIEKTPSYFITKEVPRRIFSMSPNIKLIVVVRDPVTRAISDYTQAASKRPGMKPFEHMAFLDNYTGLVNTSWGAIRIGVYAKHLDKWLKYFPLRQILFVNGEKLISDPAGEVRRVQDFLGLKRVITDKHFYFNETKGFPCLRKPDTNGRPHCLGKSKGRQHPKVETRVLQRLRDFYRPFNAKFYHLTGQLFGWPS